MKGGTGAIVEYHGPGTESISCTGMGYVRKYVMFLFLILLEDFTRGFLELLEFLELLDLLDLLKLLDSLEFLELLELINLHGQ